MHSKLLNILRRLTYKLVRDNEDILKAKLRLWLLIANKIRDNAAKNRT
jgi:hypothetical protein